jgi:hypothetical protein
VSTFIALHVVFLPLILGTALLGLGVYYCIPKKTMQDIFEGNKVIAIGLFRFFTFPFRLLLDLLNRKYKNKKD